MWNQLPLDTAAASTVITVFGPRNAAEIERVLAPGGVLITASPTPARLHELVDALGLLSVDRRKPQRHAVTFNRFHPVDVDTLTYRLALDRRDVAVLAGMGSTARHVRADAMDDRVHRSSVPVEDRAVHAPAFCVVFGSWNLRDAMLSGSCGCSVWLRSVARQVEASPVSNIPGGFAYRVGGRGEVRITHQGRSAGTLRGAAAARFLVDVEDYDPQQLMARLTGNYKHGNEHLARDPPPQSGSSLNPPSLAGV